MAGRWEHFSHRSDIGLRATADNKAEVFEKMACAMTAAISDLDAVEPVHEVAVECAAPTDEILLIDWLNALVYEMATRKLLFSEFKIALDDHRLHGLARGEPVNQEKHQPAVEIKGATYTSLEVKENEDGQWEAQCVIDV